MKYVKFALAVAGCVVLLTPPSAAGPTGEAISFAKPKRIMAGDAIVGAARYYPSPVLHDVNGDGRKDIVIADLFGKVTFAAATAKGFAAEKPLNDRDGKPLKFHNW